MRTLNSRRERRRGFVLLGLTVALIVLWLLPWQLTGEISLVTSMVVMAVIFCWIVWALMTGRAGLLSWQPTARRQRRLDRAVAERARVEATAQQQRLNAALERGHYQPAQPGPPDSGERARTRRELLDAVEQHGGLSPEARAAAEQIRRHSG